MDNKQKEEFKYQIEEIMDKTSIQELTEMITEICFEKSQHVLENWQDKNLSKIWEKNGTKFNALLCNLEKTF
jgi:hypothetical protein